MAQTGVLASFVVVQRRLHPAFQPPYVIGQVTIADTGGSVMMTTNIVGAGPATLTVGMPLTTEFEGGGDIVVPVFRPSRTRDATA